MSWLKNIFLLFFSVILSFVALELGLRAIFSEKVTTQAIRDHSDDLFPSHSEGVYRHQMRKVTATFTSGGFRVNPENCPRGQKTKKILIAGDSNIAGFFLDDSETLGAKITEKSRQLGNCINVDMFGVSGFGPDQTSFAIEKLTEQLVYNYIVFHIFADNDMGDIVRNNYYNEGALLNNGYCYLEASFFEVFVSYKALRRLVNFIDIGIHGYGEPLSSMGSRSCAVVPDYFGDFPKATHERAKIDWELNNDGFRQVYMGDRYDIEFACKISMEAATYVQRAFRHIVDNINKIARTRNFQVIYLIQPSELDVTNNHPDRQNKGCDSYHPRNLSGFFANSLANEKVIDLYNFFQGCSKCYFTESELGSDNHWSPYGVNIAAFHIASHLTENTK